MALDPNEDCQRQFICAHILSPSRQNALIEIGIKMHVEMTVTFNFFFFGGSDETRGDNPFDASLEKLKSAKEEK